jgi:hypothetical protein
MGLELGEDRFEGEARGERITVVSRCGSYQASPAMNIIHECDAQLSF